MENLNLDKDSLEKALSSANSNENTAPSSTEASSNDAQPQVSKEEEIGFHKGCLNTLVAERNELVKMVGNIEAIMQAHLGRLKELGVDVEAQAQAEAGKK